MNLSYFVATIALTISGSFGVNDIKDIASYQFENTFDNLSGGFDIYYSFNGTPSAYPSIQISTQSSVLVSHQMTANDFYSGTINSSIIGGNIYKYTFNIESIQHTNIYYFKLVNDNNNSISYLGNSINFYINSFITDYPIYNIETAYEEGYILGYDEGQEDGYQEGLQVGVQAGIDGANNSDSVFDRVFMIIRNAGASFLNLFDFYIFPNIPFYVVIAIPFIIGSLFLLFKILLK